MVRLKFTQLLTITTDVLELIRNERIRGTTQKRISWHGHVMRRDDTNVAKELTTMKVGGKRPRGRPRLMWRDRVRSDLRQHQLDPKLAQNREAWRKAVMAIGPGSANVSNKSKLNLEETPGKEVHMALVCDEKRGGLRTRWALIRSH